MSMIGYYLRADEDTIRKMQDGNLDGLLFNNDNSQNLLDIDKAWHAIHYTLTKEVWEIPENNILGHLILGGEPISEEDMGYGPARLIPNDIVLQLAEALKEWNEAAFRDNFHLEDMAANDVYPVIADEDEEEFFQYVWANFDALKRFIQDAAQDNLGVITFLG